MGVRDIDGAHIDDDDDFDEDFTGTNSTRRAGTKRGFEDLDNDDNNDDIFGSKQLSKAKLRRRGPAANKDPEAVAARGIGRERKVKTDALRRIFLNYEKCDPSRRMLSVRMHMPTLTKQVSSHIKYTGQNLPSVARDLASEAIKSTTKVVNALHIKYEPTAKELYQNYKQVVEKYALRHCGVSIEALYKERLRVLNPNYADDGHLLPTVEILVGDDSIKAKRKSRYDVSRKYKVDFRRWSSSTLAKKGLLSLRKHIKVLSFGVVFSFVVEPVKLQDNGL
ncbi:hypothetical protein M8C21_029602 [Ambrosia artemisiifolia]|uniref:Uncharacterized protein n=1 Tax=Ambrosia artemisiifolia TaxID=4212 RepID=A0AAD5CR81_AMBAR|nr:hypothetical protein M8C21_029602 [Ambrosia artemisiifolia]